MKHKKEMDSKKVKHPKDSEMKEMDCKMDCPKDSKEMVGHGKKMPKAKH